MLSLSCPVVRSRRSKTVRCTPVTWGAYAERREVCKVLRPAVSGCISVGQRQSVSREGLDGLIDDCRLFGHGEVPGLV